MHFSNVFCRAYVKVVFKMRATDWLACTLGHRGQREREEVLGSSKARGRSAPQSLQSQLHTFSLGTQSANTNKVSVFGQVKMASTDGGAHQSPKDLHAENTVPLGNLDVSSWWTALQDDSILASADADCLQHIFSRLELFDAMPLGFTCRRLYYHFKESQKRTKALKIVGETREEFKKTGDFSMQNIPVNFFKVVATFANLRSLVLATCLHPIDFETLFTQLTALPLMSTLSLNLFFGRKMKQQFLSITFGLSWLN